MVWYLKANPRKWHDNLYNWHNKDWREAKSHKGYYGRVLYPCDRKDKRYFEAAEKGDLVLLHSSEERLSPKKYRIRPRLVGVGQITKPKHQDADRVNLGDKNYYVQVTIRHLFKEDIPLFEIKSLSGLENAEPFRKWTFRYALTKLSPSEFRSIRQLILKKDPSAAKIFKNAA